MNELTHDAFKCFPVQIVDDVPENRFVRIHEEQSGEHVDIPEGLPSGPVDMEIGKTQALVLKIILPLLVGDFQFKDPVGIESDHLKVGIGVFAIQLLKNRSNPDTRRTARKPKINQQVFPFQVLAAVSLFLETGQLERGHGFTDPLSHLDGGAAPGDKSVDVLEFK